MHLCPRCAARSPLLRCWRWHSRGSRMALMISSAFESGSIEVVSASDPSDIQLKLVPEPHSELEDATFMQWFNFSVSNVEGVPLTIKILNAGEASFPSGWGPTPVGVVGSASSCSIRAGDTPASASQLTQFPGRQCCGTHVGLPFESTLPATRMLSTSIQ